jgi:hypothetical protein
MNHLQGVYPVLNWNYTMRLIYGWRAWSVFGSILRTGGVCVCCVVLSASACVCCVVLSTTVKFPFTNISFVVFLNFLVFGRNFCTRYQCVSNDTADKSALGASVSVSTDVSIVENRNKLVRTLLLWRFIWISRPSYLRGLNSEVTAALH